MSARVVAFQILMEFEKTKRHLDSLIENRFIKINLSAKERKFVFNLVSGVVRNQTLFDWKASQLHKGNYRKSLDGFKIILRLAIYEIDFLDFIPPHATVNEYVNIAKKKLPGTNKNIVNGILRTYLREGRKLNPEKKFKHKETQLSVKYSYPEWLIKRWLNLWDKQFVEDMCVAFNERPEFDIRINQTKTTISEIKQIFDENQIDYIGSLYFDQVLKVMNIQKVIQSGLLKRGLCSVQDESGLLALELINPIEEESRILDACAAPGSKLTALLEKYQESAHITALEINAARILKIKENCRRIGAKNYHIIQGDAEIPPINSLFDQILIDAPCSGLGSIQKHPDIKWRRSIEEIFRFQTLQIAILSELSWHVKPGGTIIYCTCTIDPSENEMVIDTFLDKMNGKFEIVPPPSRLKEFIVDSKYIRTFPHLNNMEGSFAVKLVRLI